MLQIFRTPGDSYPVIYTVFASRPTNCCQTEMEYLKIIPKQGEKTEEKMKLIKMPSMESSSFTYLSQHNTVSFAFVWF